MKKILFIIAFLFAGVVFANAQTPTTKDNATTPTRKAQVGDVPAAPAVPAVVTPEAANVEVNKDAAAKEKACSKQKESCNKGDKNCCKNKKATADAAKEKSCCKKDKGACHSKKADATETTTPANPVENTPAVVPGSPATPANK